MNHIADHAASFAMDQATCKLTPHQERYFKQPDNIKCPLGTHFEIVIGELTCDKNTSKSIWNAVDDELVTRRQCTPKQGAAARAIPFCQASAKLIPNNGSVQRLFNGLGNCHTRSCYKSKAYFL